MRPGMCKSAQMRCRAASFQARRSWTGAGVASKPQDLGPQIDPGISGRRRTGEGARDCSGKRGGKEEVLISGGNGERGAVLLGGSELAGGPVELAGIEGKDHHAIAAGCRFGLGEFHTVLAAALLHRGGLDTAGAAIENKMVFAKTESERREPERDENDHREGESGA